MKQILSVGIDIIEVSRIRIAYKNNHKVLNKIFSDIELEYCLNKKNKFQHLAGRFAAKEAVIKALSKKDIPLKKIEVINDINGMPQVKIHSKTPKAPKIKISISHTKNYATAIAIYGK